MNSKLFCFQMNSKLFVKKKCLPPTQTLAQKVALIAKPSRLTALQTLVTPPKPLAAAAAAAAAVLIVCSTENLFRPQKL